MTPINKINSQTIKYSLWSYAGYLIGIFSTFFLYSSELKFYGTIRYVLAISLLLTSFFTLGLNSSVVKFYDELRHKQSRNSFLSISIITVVFFTLIAYLVTNLYKNIFTPDNSANFWELKDFIFPMICIYSINSLIYSYLNNFYLTAIPNFFESFLPKIYTILSFVFFLHYKNVSNSLILFIILSFISTGVLYFYMKKKSHFFISLDVKIFQNTDFRKRLFDFSAFSLFNSFLYATISQIGMVFLGESGDFKANGMYAIILSIISLINIPLLALSKSTVPLISDFMENQKISELGLFYKKTSLLLFFTGSFILLIITTNFDAIFTILNKKDLLGNFNILIIIGLSFLIDLLTGINSNIINRSSLYKYNTLFIAITAVISLTLNYYLVTQLNYGITGVAVSSFISMAAFNSLKLWLNFKYFKISPFSKPMVPLCIVLILFLSLNRYFIAEQSNHPFLFIFINTFAIMSCYILVNQRFKIIDIFKI